MSSAKFNVGIIGYGLSAKIFHIPFISVVPDFNLYAIVQRRPKPDDDASTDHPGIQLYNSSDDLVRDDKVDVVVVTTSPTSHLELAKAALEAKKHGLAIEPIDDVAELTKKQWSWRNPSPRHRQKQRSWLLLRRSRGCS